MYNILKNKEMYNQPIRASPSKLAETVFLNAGFPHLKKMCQKVCATHCQMSIWIRSASWEGISQHVWRKFKM